MANILLYTPFLPPLYLLSPLSCSADVESVGLADDVKTITIPFIDGHLAASFVDDYGRLYDMDRTVKCLKGKNVLMLGIHYLYKNLRMCA